ncbi:hypothetical protein DSC45_03090 [Streptomyces sp. YIM 130001]|uniref:DUF4245 domain-containing protein n=1 Tax=Streptomyces sp. YIM 130001 TaxID=2259644 RepID=UPI000E65761F|nr:DUF4245 domain-containing protein [Streptomyces sp. YIM 130001]RII20808.1 hypothetical protein DSC45_03090 [Streptomyces sp. YIM 130001]
MKGKQTVRDMILSMAVIGVIVAFVYVFVPKDKDTEPVQEVDYTVELSTARRAAAYPVLAPDGLSPKWKATSVRYRGEEDDHWHLGFHAPNGQYAAVEQSTRTPRKFIEEVSQGARATSVTQEIGGHTWKRYSGSEYDALVREDKGSTTVVTGSGSIGILTKLAGALSES